MNSSNSNMDASMLLPHEQDQEATTQLLEAKEQRACIKLNNVSVDHILQGRYESAISILLHVLRIMKCSIRRRRLSSTSPSSSSSSSNRGSSCSSAPSSSAAAAVATTAGQTTTPRSNCNSSERVPGFYYPASPFCDASSDGHYDYVFRYPIAIPDNDEGRITMVKANAIAIVYNLALAFHLRLVRGTTSASAFAGSAITKTDVHHTISLYQLCHRMLVTSSSSSSSSTKSNGNSNDGTATNMDVDGDNDDEDDDGVLVECEASLFMALANNLGVLYGTLGDHDRSQSFFQYLLSTQMYVVTTNRHCCATTTTTNGSSFTESTAMSSSCMMDDFWHNTSRLVLADGSAPAA